MRNWLGLVPLLLLSPASAWAQTVEFYHLDAIGNVLAVTSYNGAVVEQHDYLPYGEELCGTQACGSVNPGQPKRFTGKERDAETGLDYFGARYYGSKIGRFTTVDPFTDQKAALVNPQKWNRYAYGLNNPLRFVDPDGREGAELNQNRDILAFASGRMSLAEYNARIQARAVGALIGLAVVGVATAPALATEASIAIGRCGTSAGCQNVVRGFAEAASGAPPGAMGSVPESDWAQLSGMLRSAARGKGNFGVGAATVEQAEAMGRAWVGEGATTVSEGKILVSADKLRQYRAPSYKPNLARIQANLEGRSEPAGAWQSNAHIDIITKQ